LENEDKVSVNRSQKCENKESSSVGGDAPFKPLDRLDGTTVPQYSVEWLYHYDSGKWTYLVLKTFTSKVNRLIYSLGPSLSKF
jgi:hypothetical protein